ncbi:MAG: type II secretion system protein [bacterium]|nr:type II secretion system protein [bacterium]
MYNNRSKGFTLIELLVVIAIIGVLSAVVLASLNTARTRGNNAAVQSNLAGMLSQAEIYYGNAGNVYATVDLAWTTASCPAAAGTSVVGDTTIKRAIDAANTANGAGAIGCAATATTYVIAADLVGGGYWCVDYTGTSKAIPAATTANLAAAGTLAVCP